jgi:hypothetical protein
MPRAPLVLVCLVLAVNAAPAQTLTPGKPAGTKAAQNISQRGLFIASSLAAIGLVFGLPGSSTTTTVTSSATTG